MRFIQVQTDLDPSGKQFIPCMGGRQGPPKNKLSPSGSKSAWAFSKTHDNELFPNEAETLNLIQRIQRI